MCPERIASNSRPTAACCSSPPHTGKDLVVLDARTRKVVKRIPIEQHGASGIQMQPDGARVFVACPRDHYVAVVDLARLEMVGKIDAGREPDGMAWCPR